MAAIEEIIKSSKKSKILITANSNTACDEIASRLLQMFGLVFAKENILRMYAKSYNEKYVNRSIMKCSNFMNGEFRIPCLKHIYSFRIIICTLLTAGCISRARQDSDFDSSHFSHIIIDECASSNETATLIPIAGNDHLFLSKGNQLKSSFNNNKKEINLKIIFTKNRHFCA